MIYYPFTNHYPLEVSHHGTRLSLKVHDLQTMAAEVGEKSIWEGLGGACWDGHMGLPKKRRFFDDVYTRTLIFVCFFVCMKWTYVWLVYLFFLTLPCLRGGFLCFYHFALGFSR